jgi:hypothetical protein
VPQKVNIRAGTRKRNFPFAGVFYAGESGTGHGTFFQERKMKSERFLRCSVLGLAVAGLLAVGAYAQTATPAPQQQDTHQDRRDLNKDRVDRNKDQRDINHDRRDVNKDRVDRNKDQRDINHDKRQLAGSNAKNGAGSTQSAALRKDIRSDRRDRNKDQRDINHDRRDLHKDRRGRK